VKQENKAPSPVIGNTGRKAFAMKAVQGLTKPDFKKLINIAWKEEDASFVVNFKTNSVIGGYSGYCGIYQFQEDEIMEMTKIMIEGLGKYAPEAEVVELSDTMIIMGKTEAVENMIQRFQNG
jgi:hypothetical protein